MNLDWKGFCHRCFVTTGEYSMSWFNEQLICIGCSEQEKERSDYAEARRSEAEALSNGDFNFAGIGFKDEQTSC